MAILFAALVVLTPQAYGVLDAPVRAPFETVLELPPGDDNPRNSEGDFISLQDGRLMFVYTHFVGGAGDHAAAHLAARFSRNGGATWSDEDTLVIPNEGGMNVMSVSLLRLQDGTIALFYLRKNAEDDCRPLLRISHDEAASWGDPVECIADEVGYYVVNNDRIIQLPSGRLLIPAALHALQGEPFSARGRVMCYLSDDNGASWRRSDAVLEAPPSFRSGYQEPGVVTLSDGRLLMVLRNDSGVFHQSFSEDGGESWTAAAPMPLSTPLSPASVKWLPRRDALLLLWNDHTNIDPGLAGKRTPLTLALSRDDGVSWRGRAVVEDDPHGWYCYTAIAFTDSHMLLAYCAGDRRHTNGLAMTRISRLSLDWLSAHLDTALADQE